MRAWERRSKIPACRGVPETPAPNENRQPPTHPKPVGAGWVAPVRRFRACRSPRLQVVLDNRTGPNVVGVTMTLVGFTVVMLMDAVRFRFPGFPLHPMGYWLALNFSVDYYWFGMLLALLIKLFVQRYYGLRGYDKLRAIAMGILVGEYAAETIWMVAAMVTNHSTYTISVNGRGLGRQ